MPRSLLCPRCGEPTTSMIRFADDSWGSYCTPCALAVQRQQPTAVVYGDAAQPVTASSGNAA